MSYCWTITLKATQLQQNGKLYRVVIQLPEFKEYINYKVMLKDFLVIRTAVLPAEEMTYSLGSNFIIDNNYDTKYSNTNLFNINQSNILTTVHSMSPYFNGCGEYLNVSKVNGVYDFWIENDGSEILERGIDYKDFILTLLIKGDKK